MKQKTKNQDRFAITEEEIERELEKLYEKEFKYNVTEYAKKYRIMKAMIGDRVTPTKKQEYKMFISAPFGNYIKHPNAISVTGTWTLHPRGNRFLSILKTLRWNRDLGGWTNKLGLPNPGIGVGLKKTFPNEVLSIAEIERNDFRKMERIIPSHQSIELNLSCPNTGKSLPWDSAAVFTKFSGTDREWCIAKVGPLTSPDDLEFLVDNLGFRQLHFSNTLPCQFGGLSGRVLRPYTLDLIQMVRKQWGEAVVIVAGGGVNGFGAVMEYLNAGANHVSVGSFCFNYFKMRKMLNDG